MCTPVQQYRPHASAKALTIRAMQPQCAVTTQMHGQACGGSIRSPEWGKVYTVHIICWDQAPSDHEADYRSRHPSLRAPATTPAPCTHPPKQSLHAYSDRVSPMETRHAAFPRARLADSHGAGLRERAQELQLEGREAPVQLRPHCAVAGMQAGIHTPQHLCKSLHPCMQPHSACVIDWHSLPGLKASSRLLPAEQNWHVWHNPGPDSACMCAGAKVLDWLRTGSGRRQREGCLLVVLQKGEGSRQGPLQQRPHGSCACTCACIPTCHAGCRQAESKEGCSAGHRRKFWGRSGHPRPSFWGPGSGVQQASACTFSLQAAVSARAQDAAGVSAAEDVPHGVLQVQGSHHPAYTLACSCSSLV